MKTSISWYHHEREARRLAWLQGTGSFAARLITASQAVGINNSSAQGIPGQGEAYDATRHHLVFYLAGRDRERGHEIFGNY